MGLVAVWLLPKGVIAIGTDGLYCEMFSSVYSLCCLNLLPSSLLLEVDMIPWNSEKVNCLDRVNLVKSCNTSATVLIKCCECRESTSD